MKEDFRMRKNFAGRRRYGRRRFLVLALLCWAAAAVVFYAGTASAGSGDRVRTEVLATSQTVAAGESDLLGHLVDVGKMELNGYFTLYVEITGDGTVTLEYVTSDDGTNYVEPTGAKDVATGYVKTSGPGSDGKDFLPVYPMRAPYIGIRATETGAANSVTIKAKLYVH